MKDGRITVESENCTFSATPQGIRLQSGGGPIMDLGPKQAEALVDLCVMLRALADSRGD